MRERAGQRHWSRWVFPAASAAFALGGLFHAWRLLSPARGDGSPPWRHALFVAINLALSVALLRRPRWLLPIFGLLVAQQLVSHGTAAWVAARRGLVDVPSLLVLIGLPALFALLLVDAKRR